MSRRARERDVSATGQGAALKHDQRRPPVQLIWDSRRGRSDRASQRLDGTETSRDKRQERGSKVRQSVYSGW